jgi:hypothetical protein
MTTTAIDRTAREISLMQEYRTRLTADIVTGKLDVREAAGGSGRRSHYRSRNPRRRNRTGGGGGIKRFPIG